MSFELVARDRVGDAVYGQATGCLGMAAVADARTLWHQPPAVAMAEAAAMPTVFLTAATCLLQSTPMRHGSTVLVHAATGALMHTGNRQCSIAPNSCPASSKHCLAPGSRVALTRCILGSCAGQGAPRSRVARSFTLCCKGPMWSSQSRLRRRQAVWAWQPCRCAAHAAACRGALQEALSSACACAGRACSVCTRPGAQAL